MRREVGHLILARTVYRSLIAVHTAAVRGNDVDVRSGLQALVSNLGPVMPELEALIAAETQSAQAHDRTQRTLAAFFVGKPRPDLHPANDHRLNPTEPDPLIA